MYSIIVCLINLITWCIPLELSILKKLKLGFFRRKNHNLFERFTIEAEAIVSPNAGIGFPL